MRFVRVTKAAREVMIGDTIVYPGRLVNVDRIERRGVLGMMEFFDDMRGRFLACSPSDDVVIRVSEETTA